MDTWILDSISAGYSIALISTVQSRFAQEKTLGTLSDIHRYGVGNLREIGTERRPCLLKFSFEIERILKKKGYRHASLVVTSDHSFRREIEQVNGQFTAFTCSVNWEFLGTKH